MQFYYFYEHTAINTLDQISSLPSQLWTIKYDLFTGPEILHPFMLNYTTVVIIIIHDFTIDHRLNWIKLFPTRKKKLSKK